MEIELSPQPEPDTVDAVLAAVARALAADGDPGPWWRAGLQENLDPESP